MLVHLTNQLKLFVLRYKSKKIPKRQNFSVLLSSAVSYVTNSWSRYNYV